MNRAPEHCLHVIQEPELVEGLRALLRGPCPALAADAAAALLRLLRYGPSGATVGDVREAHRLVALLADEGPSEALSEATGYLSALAWQRQWATAVALEPKAAVAPKVLSVEEVEREDPSERCWDVKSGVGGHFRVVL